MSYTAALSTGLIYFSADEPCPTLLIAQLTPLPTNHVKEPCNKHTVGELTPNLRSASLLSRRYSVQL